jgi:hypothetical protein
MPICATPMMMPPMTLMNDDQAGDASPRTNLEAPSMAPKKVLSLPGACGAAGLFLVDQAGGQVGVDRHLLAGHGVEGEARRDFGDAARTLGDDDEVHDDEDDEDDRRR